ncbi:hypothetical protein PFISCL1PPCAC_6307 [Pristionchus fissidentatus]|uniref:G protein-coupled receptor n=1 Tax=Pristionchus fissidentatus TaxID=1538716 RepID=A0AAV5V8Y6_9BILA|nr:hypothetical protein PFISCL1PPCAC_6307 [Pristionchus fissidentatus]
MWPGGDRIAQLIKSIVRPSHSNCSIHDPPSGSEFLSHLEAWHIVFISIAGLLTLAVLLLSLVHLLCVYFYVSIEQRRNKLYFLLSLFPVSCLSCLIGLCLPRAAVVLTSIGVLYYLLCLFVIVSLCRHLYGGRTALVERLHHTHIDFRSPPFFCILPIGWLPTAQVTERNIRWIEWAVMQAPIVRAVIVAADTVAIAELREMSAGFLKWTDTGAVVSLLLAIFGVHSLARLTAEPLRPYCFMTVFRMVDLSLLFFTAQQPMIFENILLRFDLIPCGPLLSAESNAKFVCSFVLVVQMFFLSLLSSYLLAPHRCALFDNFPARKTLSQTTDETDLTLEGEDGWTERESREEERGGRIPCVHHTLLIDTSTSSA